MVKDSGDGQGFFEKPVNYITIIIPLVAVAFLERSLLLARIKK